MKTVYGTVYGNEELKVVRAFNKEKRCVEYDVLRYDGLFAHEWFSVARLPFEQEMSRRMADHLYQEELKPRVFMDPMTEEDEDE